MTHRVFTVGRDPSCDIVSGDGTVSSVHIEVELTRDGDLFVVDRNSSNQTKLIGNGGEQDGSDDVVAIRQGVAVSGESIKLGNIVLKVDDIIRDIRRR